MQEPRPDHNLGFLVHDVARLMRVAYDRRAKALGLTRSQWWVLNNLYFNEGITQSELADLLDVEKPTLGRLLDRLEAKGWIARQADRHDRRAKRVYLTGEVQAVMRALRGIAAGLRNDALDGHGRARAAPAVRQPAADQGQSFAHERERELRRARQRGRRCRSREQPGSARVWAGTVAHRPGRRRRSPLRPLLLVGVPLLVGLAGLYWYAVSGRYVTTENAYVKSDIVTISPDIDGRVVSVEVAENQLVEQGDVLFRIDPEPFQIALDMADANILTVRHDIEASRAEFRQIEAEIDEAQERVKFFQQQAERQRELQERGIAAQVRLEEAELELAAARQRVTALREKLRTVLARLGGDPAERGRAASRPSWRPRPGATWRPGTWTTPWSKRRSTASSAGCACSPANGSRRAMPRSRSSIRTPPGSRPTSRRPS